MLFLILTLIFYCNLEKRKPFFFVRILEKNQKLIRSQRKSSVLREEQD